MYPPSCTTTHGVDQRQLTLRARDYLRVSLDRSGRARSLEEQHADHEMVATEHGWTLGESYRDESVSASRYSRKIRDGFDRLIADLENDQFGAQVLMIWEAPVVAELYRRLEAGHSLHSIARDFQERGIRTRSGLVFSPQHLRSVALCPTYTALRAHRPGSRPDSHERHEPVPVSEMYEGQWPALVSRAEWLAVQRLLRAPERKTSRPGRGKHLLSMIARCGRCGGTLAVAYRGERSEYFCRTVTPSALRGLIEPGTDIARRWASAPMSTRREVTRLLLIPKLIGALRITQDDPEQGRAAAQAFRPVFPAAGHLLYVGRRHDDRG